MLPRVPMSHESLDVLIIGGGPAGLNAALMLGRARKRVLVCDAGPPRNAAATHIHGILSRDGVAPHELRRLARQELGAYPGVRFADLRVDELAVRGPGEFVATLADGRTVTAARVLLCLGVIDELPPLPGLAEHWGTSVHLCPYCHGWELQDRRTGVLCGSPDMLEFSLLLRGWTRDVVAFTDNRLAVEPATRARLERAGVTIEERPLVRLLGAHTLVAAELGDGAQIPIAALYMRPPQRQTPLVTRLGLALDELGYVRLDEHRQTSIPGIYAAGDLTTPMQAAIMSAAQGAFTAAMLNHGLTAEQALAGQL